jgi:hypothetical protein
MAGGAGRGAAARRPSPDSAASFAMLSGGQNSLACSGVSHSIVDAVEPVGMDMALEDLHVMDIVRQHHHAALAEYMTL